MSDEQPVYDGAELVEAIFAVEQAIEALAPFDLSTSHMQQTLVQLKSKQDPWHEAKQAMQQHLELRASNSVKAVAQYAKHLEKELANRKPVWIVVHVDDDEAEHFWPNGSRMQHVFIDEHTAENCRQKALNPDKYRVQQLWGR